MPLSPQVLTLADHGSSAMPDTLEDAFAVLDRLQAELQGADLGMETGRLGLVLGWLQGDSTATAAWGQAEAPRRAGRWPARSRLLMMQR